MSSKKLAVIFPGMGYTKDKPLLYYSGKLAASKGYDVIPIEYNRFFEGIKYTDEEKQKASEMSYDMVTETLSKVDFKEYADVVFIGKSLGTIFAARYATEHKLSVHHIWYTPLMTTFSFGERDAVAFLGTLDPLSKVDDMKKTAGEYGITLHTYEGGNHSIETGDVIKDTEFIHQIMKVTNECFN
ncbi:MAG: alpha/beta hydrolase [Lachnospiraceae bacterium]|nr:alpha/beta hydrolase [Lachnospiraceae bacterium]